MDTIENINRVNEQGSFKKSPVVLKQGKNAINTLRYILLPCTEEEIKQTKETKKLSDSLVHKMKDLNLILQAEDIKTVMYIGDLTRFTAHEEVVYQYPYRKVDFRNKAPRSYAMYTMTKERQDKSTVILCYDSLSSWRSAVKKCGSTYGMILKTITSNI